MTKPTGRSRGRPPGAVKRWQNDLDSEVIVFVDVLKLLMPKLALARAVEVSVLRHYHRRYEDGGEKLSVYAAQLARDHDWRVESFDKTPVGKSAGDAPDEGFLRSEVKRVLAKERRLAADSDFECWRRAVVTTWLKHVETMRATPAELPDVFRWKVAAK
jgi:hypothetical protein